MIAESILNVVRAVLELHPSAPPEYIELETGIVREMAARCLAYLTGDGAIVEAVIPTRGRGKPENWGGKRPHRKRQAVIREEMLEALPEAQAKPEEITPVPVMAAVLRDDRAPSPLRAAIRAAVRPYGEVEKTASTTAP